MIVKIIAVEPGQVCTLVDGCTAPLIEHANMSVQQKVNSQLFAYHNHFPVPQFCCASIVESSRGKRKSATGLANHSTKTMLCGSEAPMISPQAKAICVSGVQHMFINPLYEFWDDLMPHSSADVHCKYICCQALHMRPEITTAQLSKPATRERLSKLQTECLQNAISRQACSLRLPALAPRRALKA